MSVVWQRGDPGPVSTAIQKAIVTFCSKLREKHLELIWACAFQVLHLPKEFLEEP